MAKYKKITKMVDGEFMEFQVHINKSDDCFYVDIPLHIKNALNMNGDLIAVDFKTIHQNLNIIIKDYHDITKHTKKRIAYRVFIGSDCLGALESYMKENNIESGKFMGSISTTRINGFGFCFDHMIVMEVKHAGEYLYKIYDENKEVNMMGDVTNTVSRDKGGWEFIDYTEELDNFFKELESATLELSRKMIKMLCLAILLFICYRM